MSWSITIGRIAGTEIRIHLTFLLLLAWIGFAQYLQGGGGGAVFQEILFILAVFACVLLHELGHVLAARRYGIATPDITLLPIGGLARLSRMPEKPSEEIVIAIAGPLVNVVIAVILILILGTGIGFSAFTEVEDSAQGFLARLAAVNVFLVVFNLIPAFPMDGGRVLRAALSFRLGRRRATQIAAWIGQALAFVFGFWGLMSGNVILVFIALFVFLAAQAEAGDANLSDTAKRVPVQRAMISEFVSLGPQSSVAEAADALIRTTQHEFPVVDGAGHLRGILTRDEMIKAFRSSGPTTPVIDVMTPNVPTVRSGEKLDVVIRRMREGQSGFIGVVDQNDKLVGYISQENLAELMMLGDNWTMSPFAWPQPSPGARPSSGPRDSASTAQAP
jgi:Zn-dependent protease/CBS domain-containing protein